VGVPGEDAGAALVLPKTLAGLLPRAAGCPNAEAFWPKPDDRPKPDVWPKPDEDPNADGAAVLLVLGVAGLPNELVCPKPAKPDGVLDDVEPKAEGDPNAPALVEGVDGAAG
jgi:hypothetical protein